MQQDKAKWPARLVDVYEAIELALTEEISDPVDTSIKVLLSICDHALGGTQDYFPKGDSLHNQIRDMHIYKEFDGSNHHALAIKYDLSERWIRTIISEQAKLWLKKRQGSLL